MSTCFTFNLIDVHVFVSFVFCLHWFSTCVLYLPDEVDVDGRGGEAELAKGEVSKVAVVQHWHFARPEGHILTNLQQSESEKVITWK